MSKQSKLLNNLKLQGIDNPKVLAALKSVPREAFVLPHYKDKAYANVALSIDCAQTISQPYIVALMTQALLQHPNPLKALEIGTGSGYQTAILASLIPEVWTIERIPTLYQSVKPRLASLGFKHIHYLLGDGYLGWPSAAPFDVMMVTAAAREVPQALLEQLAVGGLMVIPIGAPGEVQNLTLLENQGNHIECTILEHVAFVPLIANHH